MEVKKSISMRFSVSKLSVTANILNCKSYREKLEIQFDLAMLYPFIHFGLFTLGVQESELSVTDYI